MGGREGALTERSARVSLARHQARRAVQLSVAVGGTFGGAVLLSSNVAVAWLAGVAPASPIPFLANVALIFGGVMFAREFRRTGPSLRAPG